ncbi:MAG: hypothetical protein HZB62_01090 [Nitrospirae bacterium]|nr:hypothetical protein [Nitrospirota bacterium]
MMRILIVALLVIGIPAYSAMAAQTEKPAMTQEQCRNGSEYMISMGERAIQDARNNEERQRRTQLVTDWKTRLSRGEDPCAIYLDIFKAATSF